MIAENPLLGPEWEPLGHVLCRLFEQVKGRQIMTMQTYGRRYNLSPYTSPYVQACADEEGAIWVEVTGNIKLEPQLTDEEQDALEFYGWTRPENTPEEYRDSPAGTPNFVRVYEPGFDSLEVAEFVLTTFAGVYQITTDDCFGFSSGDRADFVAGLNKLGRLKRGDTNPEGVIFALPGKHLEMLEPQPITGFCALSGPPLAKPEA
jgi:hypothetical protein